MQTVATVLTVYGIETLITIKSVNAIRRLQQYLPFTVLKPFHAQYAVRYSLLQQYLPFTVLKPSEPMFAHERIQVATVLTVYGIETRKQSQARTIFPLVATVLTVYGIETGLFLRNL